MRLFTPHTVQFGLQRCSIYSSSCGRRAPNLLYSPAMNSSIWSADLMGASSSETASMPARSSSRMRARSCARRSSGFSELNVTLLDSVHDGGGPDLLAGALLDDKSSPGEEGAGVYAISQSLDGVDVEVRRGVDLPPIPVASADSRGDVERRIEGGHLDHLRGPLGRYEDVLDPPPEPADDPVLVQLHHHRNAELLTRRRHTHRPSPRHLPRSPA